MTFWAHWRRALGSGGTRRQMIGTAAAGLILGLGGVTVGSSLVHASERGGIFDFFQELFRGPAQPEAVPPHRPGRYANLPDGRRIAARPVYHTPRPVMTLSVGRPRGASLRRPARREAPVAAASTGQRTVCVRMCDGYLFPLGTLAARADMPVHQAACAAACPGAATSVYTLAARETELDRAVSPRGLPYRASALANIYKQRRVANCSCQPVAGAPPLPLDRDQTLRSGDVVATADSADVVTRLRPGSVARVDFRLASLTRGRNRQIEAKVGALHREAEARAFRRTLRAANRTSLVQVASVGAGFPLPERSVGDLAQVRVVTPSPFIP